jgi:CRP-like cAMP-binding protein
MSPDKKDLDPRKQIKNKKRPKILNREVYFKGQNIVEQGDDAWRAYYIESGRVEVLVKEGKHQLKVAELAEGDIFGEMSLINHEPRSATVRVIEDCTVTVIARDEIEGKIENIEDNAIRALIDVLVERLRESTKGQVQQYKSLADFQDRVTGLVDRVHVGIDQSKRSQFRKDVMPLLEDLQKVLERYHG